MSESVIENLTQVQIEQRGVSQKDYGNPYRFISDDEEDQE